MNKQKPVSYTHLDVYKRQPLNFITDRLPSYNQAAKLLSNTKHVAVKPMSNDITNNLSLIHI